MGIKIKSRADAGRAAEKLRRRGVETVLVTMDAQGALISHREGTELVRAFKVRAVDTTAAGDVSNGPRAVVLTEGLTVRAAERFANAAAALSVTRMGTQASAPRPAIQRFLDSQFRAGETR